jgi:hypothetical protein
MGLKEKKIKDEKKPKKASLKEVFYSENGKNQKLSAFELSKIANVKVSTVKAFLKKNDVNMKLTQKNTNKVHHCPAGSALPSHYQADVIHMPKYKNQNNGNCSILTVLKTVSRRAYAAKLTKLEAPNMKRAMESIMKQIEKDGDTILFLLTDGGPEFSSAGWSELMNTHKIVHTKSEAHVSSKLNRTNSFHRTLRYMFRDLFIQNENTKWAIHLQKLIDEYNATDSRAFKPSLNKSKSPEDITREDISKIYDYEAKQVVEATSITDTILKDNDYVRLAAPFMKSNKVKKGNKFIKPSMGTAWSENVYQVSRNGPNTWKIKGLDGLAPYDEIGVWHTHNLKKVPKPNVAVVSKQVAVKKKIDKQIQVSKAKDDEARNIGKNERKTVPSKTRGTRAITRAEQKKIDARKKALSER